MTESARVELLKLVESMADIDEKLREIQKKKQPLLNSSRLIRARLTLDISSEVDEKGRRVYTNDRMRAAALTIKLAENEEYQRLGEELDKLHEEEDPLMSKYERLSAKKAILMLDFGLELPPNRN